MATLQTPAAPAKPIVPAAVAAHASRFADDDIGPTPAAKAKPADPKPERMLDVIDPTCSPNDPKGPRKHDGLDPDGTITVYEFKYRTHTKVPFRHAMQFLKSGFEVYDSGNRMQVRTETNAVTGAPMALLPNQCVADLNELTDYALAKRCATHVSGDRFTPKSDKQSMIEFLVAAASPAPSAAALAAQAKAPPVGELSDLDNPE